MTDTITDSVKERIAEWIRQAWTEGYSAGFLAGKSATEARCLLEDDAVDIGVRRATDYLEGVIKMGQKTNRKPDADPDNDAVYWCTKCQRRVPPREIAAGEIHVSPTGCGARVTVAPLAEVEQMERERDRYKGGDPDPHDIHPDSPVTIKATNEGGTP